VDLDPRNDAEFEVLIILSPHTLLADGYERTDGTSTARTTRVACGSN
jgi:hypothetical protein